MKEKMTEMDVEVSIKDDTGEVVAVAKFIAYGEITALRKLDLCGPARDMALSVLSQAEEKLFPDEEPPF